MNSDPHSNLLIIFLLILIYAKEVEVIFLILSLLSYEFCCVEPFTDVTVAQLRELLELCGAKTVVSPFALTRSLRCSMIVVQSDTGFDARKADVWADQYKTVTVSREWILDCIAAHTIFPLKEHLIGRKSEALLKTMGLPKSLLE